MQQFVDRVILVKVVPGPQQPQKLGAGLRMLGHMANNHGKSLIPAMLGRGFNVHRAAKTLDGADLGLIHAGHPQDQVADLKQVAHANLLLLRADAHAVQIGSVGAAQVAHKPALRVHVGQLGVAAADRAVL